MRRETSSRGEQSLGRYLWASAAALMRTGLFWDFTQRIIILCCVKFKNRADVRMLSVLWHEMTVKNINCNCHCNVSDCWYNSYNQHYTHQNIHISMLSMRKPTICCSHSLNTFQVSIYRNYTVVTAVTKRLLSTVRWLSLGPTQPSMLREPANISSGVKKPAEWSWPLLLRLRMRVSILLLPHPPP